MRMRSMSRSREDRRRQTTRSVARRAMLRGRSIVNITEDVRKYAAEQAISEEEALKKGMEEPSAANRSAAEIASQSLHLNPRSKWTIRRVARQGEAKRSQKSKDSSRREASEKTFAPQKAAGRGCWEQPSQFVEKGAEVYAKA